METNISDTPRTDVNSVRFSSLCAGTDQWWVPRETARQLERELNEANERLQAGGCARNQNTTQFCAEAVALAEKLKRLEEALGEIEAAMKRPASNHRLMQIAGPARQVINIAKQAKAPHA